MVELRKVLVRPYEHVAYDEDGQLLAGSLMDYTLPRADHMPSFSLHAAVPAAKITFLVSKVLERLEQLAPPAVISALCDALGIVHIDMPATLENVWQKMKLNKSA